MPWYNDPRLVDTIARSHGLTTAQAEGYAALLANYLGNRRVWRHRLGVDLSGARSLLDPLRNRDFEAGDTVPLGGESTLTHWDYLGATTGGAVRYAGEGRGGSAALVFDTRGSVESPQLLQAVAIELDAGTGLTFSLWVRSLFPDTEVEVAVIGVGLRSETSPLTHIGSAGEWLLLSATATALVTGPAEVTVRATFTPRWAADSPDPLHPVRDHLACFVDDATLALTAPARDLTDRLRDQSAIRLTNDYLGDLVKADDLQLVFHDWDGTFNRDLPVSFLHGVAYRNARVRVWSLFPDLRVAEDGDRPLRLPQWSGRLEGVRLARGEARFDLVDTLGELLSRGLPADDWRYLDRWGAEQSSVTYERVGSSTGVVLSPGIGVNPAICRTGRWRITFTDGDGSFTVSALDANPLSNPTGHTSEDWTSSGVAGESALSILTTLWSGAFEAGDRILFNTTRRYLDRTPVEIMLDILSAVSFGPDEIDAESFAAAGTTTSTFLLRITFGSETTVLQALSLIARHVLGAIQVRPDGRIAFRLFTPGDIDAVPTVDRAVDLVDCRTEESDLVNEVILRYGWDFAAEEYTAQYTYPATDASNASLALYGTKVSRVWELPGFGAESAGLVATLASRLYERYRDGIEIYELEDKLHGVALEPGDLVRVVSAQPERTAVLELIETNKVLVADGRSTCAVRLKGVDVTRFMAGPSEDFLIMQPDEGFDPTMVLDGTKLLW